MNKYNLIRDIKNFTKPIRTTEHFNCKLLNVDQIEYLSNCNLLITVNGTFYDKKTQALRRSYGIEMTRDDRAFNRLINSINIALMCESVYIVIGFNNLKNTLLPFTFENLQVKFNLPDKYVDKIFANISNNNSNNNNINNTINNNSNTNSNTTLPETHTSSDEFTSITNKPDNKPTNETINNKHTTDLDIETFENNLQTILDQLLIPNGGVKFFIELLLYENFHMSDFIKGDIDHNTYKINKLNGLLNSYILTREELDILFINMDVVYQSLQVLDLFDYHISETIYSYPHHENPEFNEALEYIFDEFNNKLSKIDRELVALSRVMSLFDVFIVFLSIYSLIKLYMFSKHNQINFYHNPFINILLGLFFYVLTRVYCHFI